VAGAVRSRMTRVNVGPLLSSETGSNAEGRVTASDPSWTTRRGPEYLDTWQHWSPLRRRGGVRSLEAGSGITVARGSSLTHTLPFVLT
jgi:hypothetical protein